MAFDNYRLLSSMLNCRARSDQQFMELLQHVAHGTANAHQMQVYERHFNEVLTLAAVQQNAGVQPTVLPGRVSPSVSVKRERSEDALVEPSKKVRRIEERSQGSTYIEAPARYYGSTLSPQLSNSPAQFYAYSNFSAPQQLPLNAGRGVKPSNPRTETSLPMPNSDHPYPLLQSMGGLPITSSEGSSNIPLVKSEQPVPFPRSNDIDRPAPHDPSPSSRHVQLDRTPRRWTAEPHKLGKGKKAKYYGVRVGRIPGIYYGWSDVEKQVKGFPNAAHQAFKTQGEVEDYMNHEPDRCIYPSCVSRCKDIGAIKREIQLSRSMNGHEMERPLTLPGQTNDISKLAPAQDLTPQSAQAYESQYDRNRLSATMPLTSISANSTQTDAAATPRQVCNCENRNSKANSKEVTCANPDCKVKTYHAECVGLAKRVPDPAWKCRACRPAPTLAPGVLSEIAPGPAEPQLSAQQAAVVDLILRGTHNVCYTGSAGTGKSTVLKAVVGELEQQGKTVDIVAPSGIAALAVGGQTVFSYAGWVPDTFKLDLESITQRAHAKKIWRRLRATDVLIIEEISMVDSHVFVRLESSCREARRGPMSQWERARGARLDGKLPFGGMQVIVTGDFCQLPPVKPFKFCLYCGGDELPGWHGNHGKALICPKCTRAYEDDDKWAFRNAAWKSCEFECVELTEIHRQIDPVFTAILQKCRRSLPLSSEDKQILLERKPNLTDAVYLRPTLAEVLAINAAAFNLLPGVVYTYECYDHFAWKRDLHPDLGSRGLRKVDGRYEGRDDGPLKALQDHRFEERLELKVNTLVILLVNMNIDAGLVNGAQGKVIGFQPYSEHGYADPQEQPSNFLPQILGEYKDVRKQQVRSFVRNRAVKAWPIVKFNNNVTQIIYPQCQLSELGLEKPYSLLSRTQIPLVPAWAITVHKSQGMTLTRVEVDLSRAFEREMIYVALSRCKSLKGLKVHSLPRNMNHGPNFVVQEFLEKFQPASILQSRLKESSISSSIEDDVKEALLLE